MRIVRSHWYIFLMFILAFGLTAIWVWREHTALGSFGFPLDDSWIHAQFARNLLAGYGFSYNPGDPVSGSTSVLWTLLVSLGYVFWMNPIFPTIILGALFYFLTGWMTYLLTELVTGHKWLGVAAGFATILVSRLTFGAVSGLEVTLYAFLTAASLYLYLKHRWDYGYRQYYATGVMALAGLARPELLCLFPLALLDRFITARIWERDAVGRFWRTLPLHVAVFLLILSPAVLFNLKTVGSPFPNTYTAKVAGNAFTLIVHGRWHLLGKLLYTAPLLFVSDTFSNCVLDAWPLALSLFPGILLVMTQAVSGGGPTRSFILPLTLFGIPVLTGMFGPLGVDSPKALYLHVGRYTAYQIPAFMAIGIYGMQHVLRGAAGSSTAPRTEHRLRIGTAILLVFILGVHFSRSQLAEMKFYVGAVENIDDMQVSLGEWVRQHVPENEPVAVNDIGAIAYFGHRDIIDLVGLVTPEAARYRRASYVKYGRPEEGVMEFLKLRKPRYLVIFPSWFPRISRLRPLLEPVTAVFLKDNMVCGGDTMVVYRVRWDKDRDPELAPLPPADSR